MVAAGEDVRYAYISEVFRSSILRIFQPAVSEAFVVRGGIISENAVPESRDGIGDDERGEFAAGQNEITDGKFFIDVGDDAFIDAFVMSANRMRGLSILLSLRASL